MDAAARSFPLSRTSWLRLLGAAALALHAQRAEAQTGLDSWSASGDVEMRYRTEIGGTLFGRNAATIPATVETDVIESLEVGGTSGISDDDPGTLSAANLGATDTPRDLGEVDVKVGTFTLTDSLVTGSFSVAGPAAVMAMTLSETRSSPQFSVSNGGTLTAQVSRLGASVGAGGIARISGCVGSITASIGADVEVDASTLLSASFQGKYVLTNSTVTGGLGRFRQGDIQVEFSSVDVDNALTVGGSTTNAVPTDTNLILSSGSFESGTAQVSSGLSSGVVIHTDFEMRGASVWRSFGLFTILNETTHVDINSGSRIDARDDFRIASAFATVGSGTGTTSRIDVAGDFDLDGTFASALTIENGGYVDVGGTLTIGPLGTLNLNGGTLRVSNLDNSQGGVLNENGGTLIVPEAAGVASPVAAAFALLWLRRRRQ